MKTALENGVWTSLLIVTSIRGERGVSTQRRLAEVAAEAIKMTVLAKRATKSSVRTGRRQRAEETPALGE